MITEFSTHKTDSGIDIVDVSGRLSLGNTLQSLERSISRLIETGSRKLIVNLTDLNAIDSAGIGTLISCSGKMEEAGGQMRVAGAHGLVAKSFEMVHMHRVTSIDPDLATALSALESNEQTS